MAHLRSFPARIALGLALIPAGTAAAAWPDAPGTADWPVVARTPVLVECITADGLPWCRASTTIASPLGAVRAAILDFDAYPRMFAHIPEVRSLDVDTKYLRLDLPAPLSDRDYTVRFQHEADSAAHFRVTWRAVEHPAAPPVEDIVRLERAAGSWDLSLVPGGTRLVYTWEAELQGALADWIVARARATTGEEVVGGVVGAVRGR
jgi:hypothetical protein